MSFKKLFRYRIYNFSFLAAMAFILGGWAWAFVELRSVETPLIILFDSVSGINHVGYVSDFLRVAIFGMLVVFVNFLISVELERKMPFWGRLTSFVTVFLGVLIFIYFAAIISVN